MTIIVGLLTAQGAIVGVDSCVTAIDDTVTNAPFEPKLHEINGTLFAHAGLFRNASGQLDVVTLARSIFQSSLGVDAAIDSLALALVPKLVSALSDLRSMNSTYFAAECDGKNVLELLYAWVEHGVPALAVHTFLATKASNPLEVTYTKKDCRIPNSLITLGTKEDADILLDSPDWQKIQDSPLEMVRAAINQQALKTPEKVLLPVNIAFIGGAGVVWF